MLFLSEAKEQGYDVPDDLDDARDVDHLQQDANGTADRTLSEARNASLSKSTFPGTQRNGGDERAGA